MGPINLQTHHSPNQGPMGLVRGQPQMQSMQMPNQAPSAGPQAQEHNTSFTITLDGASPEICRIHNGPKS
eukprot:NODE_267_length_2046_cov_59.812719_g182_i0.p6 GENE.NODE_267_length_2046_cov_59.812719_g182_i0~~NODE_267_length_2046_cov_59.812719_g182_i0.p6  ORF type:complete len:70 (+),score=12.98 NODE_267_length_2046_cov_59.812719_g182_i0:1653-1862(+)